MTVPDPKIRWLHPTPGHLLLVLLAAEGLLLLSNWMQWIPKGWSVLIAVAAVGVFLIGMLLWFVLALLFRWRFQFSLRSIMVLMLAVAIPASWLAVEMKRAREQRVVVDNLGGRAGYDYESDSIFRPNPRAKLSGPEWLRYVLGDEFFFNVTFIFLSGSKVTDCELEQLERLKQLQLLWIGNNHVTDAEVEKLKKALPNVQIFRLTIDPLSIEGQIRVHRRKIKLQNDK